jgi:hypothetical protein
MDGFDGAVDGYYDVEDQLSRYVLSRAESRLRGGDGPLADVESRADADAHRDMGPSFYERARSRTAPFDESLTVFDVVGDCDVPHALAALAARGVTVDREAGEP